MKIPEFRNQKNTVIKLFVPYIGRTDAAARVVTDRQTDRQTDRHTQASTVITPLAHVC